jgi:hypothetical protein
MKALGLWQDHKKIKCREVLKPADKYPHSLGKCSKFRLLRDATCPNEGHIPNQKG